MKKDLKTATTLVRTIRCKRFSIPSRHSRRECPVEMIKVLNIYIESMKIVGRREREQNQTSTTNPAAIHDMDWDR